MKPRSATARLTLFTGYRFTWLILLLVLLTFISLSWASRAEAVGVRAENPEFGMRGVQALVNTHLMGYDFYPQILAVKLVNQYGSNRLFQWGFMRQVSTWPTGESHWNQYMNLQIRRGSSSPTLLDWYIGPYDPHYYYVYQPGISLYSGTSYTILWDDVEIGRFSWYNTTGNTAGTIMFSDNAAKTSGEIGAIYVRRPTGWLLQQSTYFPDCYIIVDDPIDPVYGWYHNYYSWYCRTLY